MIDMWRIIGFLLALTVAGCNSQGIQSDHELPTSGQAMSSVMTLPGQDGSEVFTTQQATVFKVVEAPAGELNVDTLGNNATVQVRYPTLATRDTVGVRLTGVALRDAPIQTVSTVGVLTFNLPKAWITENLNRTVTLTYTYKVGGAGNLITSSPLSIRVIGAQGQTVFKVVEAPAGELNADSLGANATVQVRYPTLATRDTVGVRLTGVALRDAPIQTVSTVDVLTFNLPKAWITENLNRTVNLTYTYKVGGAGSLITSSALPVRIVAPLSAGAKTVENINRRYESTPAFCGANAAYYCSGVVIRATENGNYDPWNPSPSAIALGAVSFSFMRKDANVKSLYHNSGFIFLNPDEAIPQKKIMEYLCIYAWDGATLIPGRLDKGCGFKPMRVVARDLSTCASKNVRTPAQWYAFTKTIPNEQYQCSLSTADPAQFLTSITVRANRPANIKEFWNELMINLWPQNEGQKLPIEAFFYNAQVSTSLAEAKTYQTKYKNKTGLWVPVVRLDFAQLQGKPFTFNSGDQAIQQ
ncbi:hypothetical protein ACYZTR_22500 [Pseudomonas sp. Hz4]